MQRFFRRIGAAAMLVCIALAPAQTASPAARTPRAAARVASAGAPPDTNFVRAGHSGGLTSQIVMQGSYAYFGRGSDLVIMDVSSPGGPRLAGKIALPDFIYDIAIAGTLAYIADNNAGLRIVDIHDPAAPAELAAYSLPNPSAGVALDSGRAYVSTWRQVITGYPPAVESQIVAFDITTPSAPKLIGSVPVAGSLGHMRIAGQYLYAISAEEGIRSISSTLLAFDLDTPGAPVAAGSVAIAPSASLTTIVGARAYLTAYYGGSISALVIVDLSSPYQPAIRGEWRLEGLSIGMPIVSANIVYLPTAQNLIKLDVTDPLHPTQVGLLPPIPLGVLSDAGNKVVIADEASLSLVDLAGAPAPKLLWSVPLFGGASVLAIEGQYAYVGDRYRRIWAIDLSAPDELREAGHIDLPAAQIIARSGYLYLASQDQGLKIVDFSTPATPRVVGRYTSAGSNWATGLALTGTVAYLASTDSLKIIDIANPARPRLIAERRDLALSGAITIAGTSLYGLDSAVPPNLYQIDIASPTKPRLLRQYPGISHLFAADQALVYATDLENNLLRFDAGNPAEPSTNLGLASYIKVAVIGRYVYANTGAGLRAIDIGVPTRPREVALASGISADELAQANGQILTASIWQGLYRIQQRLGIRGLVADPNGLPAAGVTVGAGAASAQTDATGAYTVTGLLAGPLTLAPAQPGVVFAPAARSIALAANLEGQNFRRLAAPAALTVGTGQAATLSYTDTQGLRSDLGVPTGALSATTALTITPALDRHLSGQAGAGHAFVLAAAQGGAGLAAALRGAPLTLTLRYSPADIRSMSDPGALALRWWDGQRWADGACGPATLDRQARQISVPICRLGAYQLAGPTHQLLLPLVGG